MKELWRLREETFRAIGEGTGKPLDTDEFDQYYSHLILWHVENQEIVGAYRIGFGSKIWKERGRKGFYTDTLVQYGPDAEKILPHALELGRSFISAKYQREVLPLKFLLAGLAIAAVSDPEIRCYIGTVSISDRMPLFYKSLIVDYMERDFRLDNPDAFSKATHPLKKDFLRVNPTQLMQIPPHDIEALDRFIGTISNGVWRLPVLVRKYFSCGAYVACFNVDPLFCNSLDAMIVLKFKDFPQNTFRSITRTFPDDVQARIYKHFYETPDNL